jgi:hypothetical protein
MNAVREAQTPHRPAIRMSGRNDSCSTTRSSTSITGRSAVHRRCTQAETGSPKPFLGHEASHRQTFRSAGGSEPAGVIEWPSGRRVKHRLVEIIFWRPDLRLPRVGTQLLQPLRQDHDPAAVHDHPRDLNRVGLRQRNAFACPLVQQCRSSRKVLLTRWRRVLPHVDHILDAVINVPLARFQGGGMRLADHCLEEAPLTLINHEVPRGPLLAPKNLALQHPLSISHHPDAPVGLGDLDEAATDSC